MLSQEIKRNIDTARDILVGKIPDPKGQIDQITSALIYKFMDDIDRSVRAIPGGKASFFVGGMVKFAWHKLFVPHLDNQKKADLYTKGIGKLSEADHLPSLFHDIFKDAFVPFRAAETIALFLNAINKFPSYQSNSEELGNAFEYLLHFMGTQGDAGQFRTPRHIIDFIVAAVSPSKDDTILDPACGTAGFLVSAYKHITDTHRQLTPSEMNKLAGNLSGVDIDPQMAKLARVNLYLHGFKTPRIHEDDTLTNEALWADKYNIILTNPPFMTPKGGIKPHDKFIIKAKRSEVLFVDYIAEHLRLKGRAGIVVPEGIVFQAANAYKELRKKLIEDCGLYAVVSLPSGVFNPYSGVKTSILLLDRGFTCNELLFVKIDNDGYGLNAQRRKSDKNDLPTALTVMQQWKQTQHIPTEYEALAHSVTKAKIAEDGVHNLTGERYRKTVDYRNAKWPMVELREVCEIKSGGTPKRNVEEYWNGDIPWVGSTVCKDAKVYESDECISKLGLEKSSAKLFQENTTLIALVGATIGKTALLKFESTTNQNIAGLYPNDDSVLNQIYLFYICQTLYEEFARLGDFKMANISFVKSRKIPLPPLEVQKQIASEIDAYQKVIDGAKQVIANWKPSFRIDPNWEMVELGKVCEFEYGKPLKGENRKKGKYPVFGSNGIVGYHDTFLVKAPFIIVGRKGTAGAITWSDKNGFPIDTTFYVKLRNKEKTDLKYLFYIMSTIELGKGDIQTGVPGLNRNDAYKTEIPLPSLEIQKQIVSEIEMEQEIVNANKKLIDTIKKKIEAKITAVWGNEVSV